MLKPTMDINGFDSYYAHILISQNNQSGELELKNIGDKWKYKNEFFFKLS